jgi:hypothetical protein
LDRIGEGMHRHGAVEILDEINVVFLGLGDVRNLSFAGDTRFKARWQSDATFRTLRNIVDEVEAVSTLTVNGDITEN